MWINKKRDRPQATNTKQKNSQTNQPLKPAPTGGTADPATSRLGSTLHVKGEISGNEDLVIDGSVEGLIQLDERQLTVGTTARVMADIFAGEVVIYGKVKGTVRAKGKIEIKKDGSVDGDLSMAQILIEDGAYFKGSIEIERNAEKEADKNVLPPAA
jgi:cytoskeletal protein CcmA (bactofilin family)